LPPASSPGRNLRDANRQSWSKCRTGSSGAGNRQYRPSGGRLRSVSGSSVSSAQGSSVKALFFAPEIGILPLSLVAAANDYLVHRSGLARKTCLRAPRASSSFNGAGRVNMPGLDCQAGPVKGNKICKRKVEKGKAVTAEAVPGDGLAFTSWAGACIGSNARCIFTPTKNVTIAATFGAKPQTVNATVEIAIPAPGGGRVIPAPFAGLP
jgi:hypothetical protein